MGPTAPKGEELPEISHHHFRSLKFNSLNLNMNRGSDRLFIKQLDQIQEEVEISPAQKEGPVLLETENEIEIPLEDTKIGSKIKDEIQKNIITMILLILISVPLFNVSTYFDRDTVYSKSINQLAKTAAGNPEIYDTQVPIFVDEMRNFNEKLIVFQVERNASCCKFPDDYADLAERYGVEKVGSLRPDEIDSFVGVESAVVAYNARDVRVLTAQLSIGRTIFVCIVLVVSTLLFSQDLETYALEPVENML